MTAEMAGTWRERERENDTKQNPKRQHVNGVPTEQDRERKTRKGMEGGLTRNVE